MTSLSGKAAIITGASRGIGAATAKILAAEGVKVLLAARTVRDIDAVAAEIRDAGGTAETLACDVSRYFGLQALVKRCKEQFGSVDILINNAGVIQPISMLGKSDPEDWGHAIDINLKGVYYGIRAVLPDMVAQGSGTIINISSGAAHAPLEGWSAYCSSKAGAAMLTRCADHEVDSSKIRVIGLSPGTVATEMQVAIKASGVNPVSQLDPSVHIPADWPARCIAWLCGDAGNEFTGQEVSLRDEDIRRRIGLID
ncbi:SDR family oxidoreductase [Oceanomicrobium pacificus]|uniref:SDR family NAD(P)-dependent oxidoreductase n=1 Tax=Oceanomicrobium pacificus TaxID=2692916 RepID=A0A6B0TLR3_9RHOB|nr:SDR family oxidoreductase [Oceanomicrobium pacificus]MXU64836.1 SDR family NAD(P)-dependent oxidoreductase [Oceanomicrobium pacificus]